VLGCLASFAGIAVAASLHAPSRGSLRARRRGEE
jgi:hypothetical protein